MRAFLIASFILSGSAALAGRQADEPFLVKPYVQLGHREDGKANSLTVVWHTPDVDTGYQLHFRQGNARWRIGSIPKTRRVALPNVPSFRVAESTMANLRSDQRVEYRVQHGQTTLFIADVAAPKNDRQPYRFAVFGDCGMGNAIEAAINFETYKTKPDLLMITGDIVYSNGRISEYASKFFPYFNADEAKKEVGAPIMRSTLTVGAAGNHDILMRDFTRFNDPLAFFLYWVQPLNGPLTQAGDPLTATLKAPAETQAAFQKSAGDAYPRGSNYSFDYGNAHWTVLDANPYVNWSSPRLRTWLEQDLKKAKNKTWRFIALHQPPFHSSEDHQEEKQIRAIADIIEANKVDIVFGGHVHNYQRTFPIRVGDKKVHDPANRDLNDWPIDRKFDGKTVTRPNGVLYIVDGAAGARLYNAELNGKPELWKPFQQAYLAVHSFSVIDVNGRTLRLRQLDLNGNEIDAITVQK